MSCQLILYNTAKTARLHPTGDWEVKLCLIQWDTSSCRLQG